MPGEGAASPVVTLKTRAEFLRVRGGARFGAQSFLLEANPRPAEAENDAAAEASGVAGEGSKAGGQPRAPGGARFGFTVTKKIGNAVVRNRIRRRLKEALRSIAGGCARAGCDYVLIAREGALTQQFTDLKQDLAGAFRRVHDILDGVQPQRKQGGRRKNSRRSLSQ